MSNPSVLETYRIRPVVLLTFANEGYAGDDRYLRHLVRERIELCDILAPGPGGPRYDVVYEQNLTPERLEVLLTRHRDAIVGFHYGGHARPDALGLQDHHGARDPVSAAALARALGALPRLRWVFLNGCSTKGMVESIHAETTAAVIATRGPVGDDDARAFASSLYRRMVGGHTLSACFEGAGAASGLTLASTGRRVDGDAAAMPGPARGGRRAEAPACLVLRHGSVSADPSLRSSEPEGTERRPAGGGLLGRLFGRFGRADARAERDGGEVHAQPEELVGDPARADASTRFGAPVERPADGCSWTLRDHRDGLTSAVWSLPAELAAYGLAGRLRMVRPRRMPRDAVSQLLVARNEVVPFTGREAEIAELDDWAASEEPIRIRLIHGVGGVGKTRLLHEWIKRRAHDELIGFLGGEIDDATVGAVCEARVAVLVIDYAETRAGLDQLVFRLAHHWRAERPARLRIVLLARNGGDWWTSLKARDADAGALLEDSPRPLGLPALVAEADRPTEFFRAAAAFAAERGRPTPEAAPDLSDPRFGRALYLHMAALAAVVGLAVDTDGLIAGLLAHEKRMWLRRAGIDAADRDVADRFVDGAMAFMGAVTLRGGVGERPTGEALAGRFVSDGPHLARLMHGLYEDEAAWIGPIEPDLLGESLVGGLLASRAWPTWLATAAEGARVDEATHAFTVLGWVEMTLPEVAAEGFEVLLEHDFQVRAQGAFSALMALGERTAHSALAARLPRALAARGGVELAAVFADRVPLYTTMLRETALWIEEVLLGVAEGAERAHRLNAMGVRLAQLGRHEEALAVTAEAVAMRRVLASESDDHLPALATSLGNLGTKLFELGRFEEALGVVEEAVDAAHALSGRWPDDHRESLAKSLYNLGLVLDGVGRLEEAHAASREAASMFRELVVHHPDRFLPALGTSLGGLGVMLSGLGRPEEALSVTVEAVAVYRALAARRPDAFSPALAMCLNNLGTRLAALGRRQAALEANAESVALYRALAATQPDVFRADLAHSLNNLGARQLELGQADEALRTTEEAITVKRALVETHPEAFLPDLALSVNNLGIMLSAMDRLDDALAATEDAVALYRALSAHRPAVHLSDLAMSLTNLSVRFAKLGRGEDALSASREAVVVYRQLVSGQPDAHLPNLAAGLGNLGRDLSIAGHLDEAISTTEEAVELLRTLSARRPDVHLPRLAGSLGLLGSLLDNAGRTSEAVAITDEAIATLWPAFELLPRAFVPLMATMIEQRLELGDPSAEVMTWVEQFNRVASALNA